MEQPTASVPVKRPIFLSILCIITWIGCVINLIIYAIVLLVMGAVSPVDNTTVIEDIPVNSEKILDNVQSKIDAANANGIDMQSVVFLTGVIGVVLVLIGSVLMWKLKKIGFYIYVLAEITPVVAMIIWLRGMMFNNVSGIAYLIFTLLFVLMYRLNLKSMK